MSKILNFEEYLKSDRFREQVVLPLLERNPIYESLRQDNFAIAFLHYHLYIYVFLKYVPYGDQTDLPTVKDSFNNVINKPRISNGEWVVEEFHRLKKEDALGIYPLIYSKTKKDNWLDYLKQSIQIKSKVKFNTLEEQQNDNENTEKEHDDDFPKQKKSLE